MRDLGVNLGFVGPCIFTHSNESTNQMQQLIIGLLFVVYISFNMFRASLCPSSGAYQLQQQPLVYLRNVVVAVLLAVFGPDLITANGTATTTSLR
jgi:branched-subunit amino acid transport protein